MKEIQKVKGYELTEIKSPSGDLQEIKFKVHSVLGVDNYTKNIVLGVIVVVGIIFCFIQLFFLPFFVFVFLFLLNTQTITVDKKRLEIKNLIPVFPKTNISVENIDHFEVKRVESTNKDGKTSISFELVAFFKDKTTKNIYSNANMELVDKMDKTIEKFLNITDESNEKQLDELNTSNLERVLKDDSIVEDTLSNVDTSKPSKEYPFSVQSNLISDKVVYFPKYNQKGSGIFLVLFGLVFTIFSAFIFSPIGIPLFIWGLTKLFNKQKVNVFNNKLTYCTKPIAIKKEKELLTSQIKSIEVIPSNVRTNGVLSFHLVAYPKKGKKIKLIRHVFNVIALRDICDKINKRLGLEKT
ncbi:MAG: hypothetical protein ACJ0QL_07845 [Parvicellaceae bacterium]